MTTIQSRPLPEAIKNLPGVSEPATPKNKEVINLHSTTEVSRASQPNLATEHASAEVRQAFEADLAQNPTLVRTLQAAHMNPMPEKLVRLSQEGRMHPEAFSAMVKAAQFAALADGRSGELNNMLTESTRKFVQASALPATHGPELSYFESRIMLEAQSNERDNAIQNLREAVAQAEAQLKDLQETQDLMDRAYGDDGKVDQGSDDSKAAAAELEDRGFEMDNKTEAADSNNDGKISQTEQSQYNQSKVTDQIQETTAMLKSLREQLQRLEAQPAGGVPSTTTTASESTVDLLIKNIEDIRQLMIEKAQATPNAASNHHPGGNQ